MVFAPRAILDLTTSPRGDFICRCHRRVFLLRPDAVAINHGMRALGLSRSFVCLPVYRSPNRDGYLHGLACSLLF